MSGLCLGICVCSKPYALGATSPLTSKLPHRLSPATSPLTMAPAPPSAHAQRTANHSAGVLAAPKLKSTSRKRQNLNVDELASKRNKRAANDSDDAVVDAAIVAEEANDGQKGGKKGKKGKRAKKTGGKGKNKYLFYFLHSFYT